MAFAAGVLGLAAACGAPASLQLGASGAKPAVPAQVAGGALVSSVSNPIPGTVPLDAGKPGWPGLAFVGGGESNKIWILDARNHKLVDSIDVGGPMVERTDARRYPNLRDAHAVVFTKDFKALFTVDSWEYAQSWAIKYDPVTLKEVGRAPAGVGGHHLALSPDDKYLYVGNEYDTTVSVIDTKTMRKIADLEVGKGPDYITPTMYWDGKVISSPYLFVSVDKDNQVAVIDWQKNTVVKIIPFAGSLHGINLTPDGKRVWANVIGTKQIAVIDVASLAVVHTIDLEKGGPVHTVFSPDGKWAYVTAGGQLLRFNTETFQLGWVSATGGAHLGVTPDGKEVWTLAHTFEQGDRYPYVLGGGPLSNAKVVDAESGQFIAEIPFEYRPHEIQFVPYSAVGQPKVASAAPQATPAAQATAAVRSVKVTATYDTFQPDTITAKAGERLHFEIDNLDAHAHDFVAKGDTPGKINVDVPESAVTAVDWTAPAASGKYLFECDIHPGQVLTVIVP